jgi:hypothetical protein
MPSRESTLFSRIGRWIEDRWPLTALIRIGLEEEMPGGASFACFGSEPELSPLVNLFHVMEG